jgi:hypothetical protein
VPGFDAAIHDPQVELVLAAAVYPGLLPADATIDLTP